MFNPRPTIRHVALPGHAPCVVVDDFLLEPQRLVEQACARRAEFAVDPTNYYPGPELGLDQDIAFRLDEFFMQHVRRSLGARRTISVSNRLSLATLAPGQLRPLQRLCHRDAQMLAPGEGVAASVLYLFGDTSLGGTSFYRPTRSLDETARFLRQASAMDGAAFSALTGAAPGYLNGSNDWFEQIGSIPAAFNRAIFYDGEIFHAAQIDAPKLLSADPASGRLTMNGFFRHRRSLA